MSRVIRLNDLLNNLSIVDDLYLNGISFCDISIWDMDILNNTNPLVHIDLVETHQEEGPGAYGTTTYIAYTYHVTII